jgi:hypothetical protein
MLSRQYDLLFLSIFLIGLGASLALVPFGLISLLEVFPLVTIIMGLCMIGLASLRREQRGSFGSFSWGLILVVGGFMGILFIRNIYSGFFLPAILIVLGLIGLAAALRTRKEKE